MWKSSLPLMMLAIAAVVPAAVDAATPTSTIQPTPSDTVHRRGLSPDGKILASVSLDNGVRFWDAQSGKGLALLKGHTEPVDTVAFSKDCKTAASGGNDFVIKIWDVATRKLLRTIPAHKDANGYSLVVRSLAFSPDGKTLASGTGSWTHDTSNADSVRLWDVASGKELHAISPDGHQTIASLAFSPDGKILACGGDDDITFWNADSGAMVRTLSSPDRDFPTSSVAFSPDGKMLASGGGDENFGRVQLWDVATGKQLRDLKGHERVVNDVAFSPDGKTLATGGLDELVKLWNVSTGKEERTLNGHTTQVLSVSFSPDGKILFSGGYDCIVRRWDVATGKSLGGIGIRQVSSSRHKRARHK